MEFSFPIGCRSSKASVFLAISFMLILNCRFSFVTRAYAQSQVHIVYLGERQHDDPKLVTDSHHRMLESILGSKEAARMSLIYSYQHGFSGFAARLTDSQAKKISELPEVIHVLPNRYAILQTIRSWDYLGLLPSSPKGLLHDSNMGSEAIIGVIDSGVWPESEVFNDKGLGPIPKRWKGNCASGDRFDAKMHCNKKLIGAKYFIDGLREDMGGYFNTTVDPEYISPRDSVGHGTQVSSVAAGSFVPNVSYMGFVGGTVRGGAPRARIAMYKACWNISGGICSTADVLKAFDDAIHDGVDVLSVSMGSGAPVVSEIGIAIGAFHAVAKGIPVVCSAGNYGPDAQLVNNIAPWMLTVAATTLDRSFPTRITLGNNQTILGESLYVGPEIGFSDLFYIEYGTNGTTKGKVVLDFSETGSTPAGYPSRLKREGALGIIIARNPSDFVYPCPDNFPCIYVDFDLGTDMLFYVRSTRSPTVKIHPSKMLTGQPVGIQVAETSSRGPNSFSPAILKPDIAAPGVSILTATIPKTSGGYEFSTGTSMATPIIAGIVALLKVLHPDWSPAAIKSAIVTTAWKTDPSGEPIFADGSSRKLADPFDYGGGLVNPEKAADPGLVYDMVMDDYIHYLCSTGYDDSSISKLVGKAAMHTCPKSSILDVNLPSITIPELKEDVTLIRTVTNVGPVDSVYKAVIEAPLGINIVVKPETLVFNSTTKKITFSVRVSTTFKVNTGYSFGSLTWIDGHRNVTIPLSVRTQILKYYN